MSRQRLGRQLIRTLCAAIAVFLVWASGGGIPAQATESREGSSVDTGLSAAASRQTWNWPHASNTLAPCHRRHVTSGRGRAHSRAYER